MSAANLGTLEEAFERIAALEALSGKVASGAARMRPRGSEIVVAKTSHGFSLGNVLRHDGTNWVKSQADTAANAIVGGIVSQVLNVNAFVLALPGSYVAGISTGGAGQKYLDAATAGALTGTPPSIAVPALMADSTTSGIVLAGLPPSATLSAWTYTFDANTSTTPKSLPSGIPPGRRLTIDCFGAVGGYSGTSLGKIGNSEASFTIDVINGGAPGSTTIYVAGQSNGFKIDGANNAGGLGFRHNATGSSVTFSTIGATIAGGVGDYVTITWTVAVTFTGDDITAVSLYRSATSFGTYTCACLARNF